MGATNGTPARTARLAAALRENLTRRKAQARERTVETDGGASGAPEPEVVTEPDVAPSPAASDGPRATAGPAADDGTA
jgi:hypothetical protein